MSSVTLLTRQHAESPRLLLTARQTAEALAISSRTLWELTNRGELTPIRLPGRGKARSLRYAVADLERWIARRQATTEAGGNS
jgi:predicted DNA-binding transcriptional regulator AlpA